MCLAIPMRLIKREGDKGIVEAGDLRKDVNLSLMKNVKAGDYILMHAGFAIEKLKESEAKKTLKVLREM